jgi:RNA polymerase sigma factor (sigma-70 family)
LRDDSSVIALVDRARDGDREAWDELVERYASLVWSVCRRYRLSRSDADDAAQGTWLRLIEHLPTLRDPAALPGWLATTTHRECLRVLRGMRQRTTHELPLAAQDVPGTEDPYSTVDHRLVAAERGALLREAYRQLSTRCQDLLGMLMRDPPPSYQNISTDLDMPIGSIGPNRARCLDALRRSPLLAGMISEHDSPRKEAHDDRRVER